jgi:hypothetical protein
MLWVESLLRLVCEEEIIDSCRSKTRQARACAFEAVVVACVEIASVRVRSEFNWRTR